MDLISKRIRIEHEGYSKLLSLKAGLMHDLLTGRVRVPTDSTIPSSAHV